jgi:hypothetical protein
MFNAKHLLIVAASSALFLGACNNGGQESATKAIPEASPVSTTAPVTETSPGATTKTPDKTTTSETTKTPDKTTATTSETTKTPDKTTATTSGTTKTPDKTTATTSEASNPLLPIVSSTKTAVEAGNFAKAKTEFENFDKSWKDIEDGVKAKSPDSYKAIEDSMDKVTAELKQSKPAKDKVVTELQALEKSVKSVK